CFGDHCELPWSVAGRHPTPLYATLWELPVLFLLLVLEAKRDRLPFRSLRRSGGLFYFWVFLHGLGRLMMEYWRVDDRGPMPLGLSVSTWISLALVLAATLFLFRPRPNKSS
ncbi:MAG: prolipoprotein diacylglyceryl transferase, partial [Bdellovibrionales bacterium]|nr:prolipoprotein diacylglyceryl transferase [Bdellovibrionales bacterium]